MKEYPLKVTSSICANGETYEHRVMFGDVQVGKSVFTKPLVGDSLAEHALVALKKVLERASIEAATWPMRSGQ